MSTVYDVAKYIIEKSGWISTMKLQKLLFYSQAMAMVWDEAPLFDDDFEAWTYGPICRKLWEAHKGLAVVDNTDFLNKYQADSSNIMPEHKETIDVVLDSFKDAAAYQLSEKTHNEAPWLDARQGLPMDAQSTNIITKESMAQYYAKHW